MNKLERFEDVIRWENGSFNKLPIGPYLTLDGPFDPRNMTGLVLNVMKRSTGINLDEYLYELWPLIEEMLHFRSKYIIVKYMDDTDRQYQVDVWLGPWVISEVKGLQIFMPLFQRWFEVNLKLPDATATSMFYLRILSADVWIAVLLCMLFIAFIPMAMRFLLMRIVAVREYMVACGDMIISFTDSLLGIISIVANQGLHRAPSLPWQMIMSIVVLLFGFMLNTYYSALLVANLSRNVAILPFSNLDELGTVRSHRVCAKNGSYEEHMVLTTTKNPEYIKQHLNSPDCPTNYTIENIIKTICTSKHVVMVTLNDEITRYAIEQGSKIPCEITTLKDKYFAAYGTVVADADFRYTRLINEKLLVMREAGILNRMYAKHVALPPHTPEDIKHNRNQEFVKVSLSHVQGLFLVYTGAILLSLLVLMVELSLNRHAITAFMSDINVRNFI